MSKLNITINGQSVPYDLLDEKTTKLIELLNTVTIKHAECENELTILHAAKLELSRQIVSSYEQLTKL